MARFNVGDEIYSKMNPFIKYKILQVGLLNEKRELEYEVENISEDQMYAGRKYRMRISKVDSWGVLIVKEESKKKKPKVSTPIWRKCKEKDGIRNLCFESGAVDTCLVWNGFYLSIAELEKLLPKEK